MEEGVGASPILWRPRSATQVTPTDLPLQHQAVEDRLAFPVGCDAPGYQRGEEARGIALRAELILECRGPVEFRQYQRLVERAMMGISVRSCPVMVASPETQSGDRMFEYLPDAGRPCRNPQADPAVIGSGAVTLRGKGDGISAIASSVPGAGAQI